MRRFALVGPLLAAGSVASPQPAKNYNSTGSIVSSSSATSQQDSFNAQLASSTVPGVLSSSNAATSLSLISTQPLSTSGSTSVLSSSPSSPRSSALVVPGFTPSNMPSTIDTPNFNATVTRSSQSVISLSSSFTRNTSLATPSPCTGCVLQAYDPITSFYDPEDASNPWTSIVVTETILTEYITYLDGTTIDAVVTETKLVNQTKTLVLTGDDTITHNTPVFTIEPTPGVTLTVDAGPTYVIYNNLYGALEHSISTVFSRLAVTFDTCMAEPTPLTNWEPLEDSDWNYFIETFKTKLPEPSYMPDPVVLPPNALRYLQNNMAIQSIYRGSNLATCTTNTFSAPNPNEPSAPNRTTEPVTETATETPPASAAPSPGTGAPAVSGTENVPIATSVVFPFPSSISTGTFLSTTYASTSTHITRAGCLRCDNSMSNNIVPDGPTPPANVPRPSYTPNPPVPNPNPPNRPDDKPGNQQQPHNNPESGQTVRIGDSDVTVKPADQNQNSGNPNEQNQAPGVIVGSETLTQGQSTVINGVPVVVPLEGSGSYIVAGGTTIPINSAPTGAPVLTVGQNIITANSQGQFAVGTQTLSPGGPAIIVDGSTLSLGPSNNVAIVNGVTQTLANGPVMTPPPVLTVGSQAVTATLIGGTMAFIFGPGQTLTPGGVLTISQTTLSMPASASGSVIVINGVTSTFGQGPVTAAAALTIDGTTYSATVRDGTTEFVLGQGITLRPGEVIIISGTTYSLDASGTALVINGKTSTIPRVPASNSASTTASSGRNVGDFVCSGIGGNCGTASKSSSKGGAGQVHPAGFDKWIESLVIAAAGWLMVFL